jgi:hypothetical protein
MLIELHTPLVDCNTKLDLCVLELPIWYDYGFAICLPQLSLESNVDE